MITFFAIVLVLLLVNIALLLFSTTNSKLKINNLTKSISDKSSTKIYPLDLDTSKYKKAI